jgi:hypothetical protein
MVAVMEPSAEVYEEAPVTVPVVVIVKAGVVHDEESLRTTYVSAEVL